MDKVFLLCDPAHVLHWFLGTLISLVNQVSSSVPLAKSDSFAHPVRINSFLKVIYSTDSGPQVKFVFVSVSWYCTHPGYISFGKPVQLRCSSIFEVPTLPTFIPVSLLDVFIVSLIAMYIMRMFFFLFHL